VLPSCCLGSSIRRALIIGNDSYPGNKLQNARNDARAVAERLSSLGYKATLAIDVNRRSLAIAIDSFAASITPGDTALIYYAGHGLQVKGDNYLVPIDFRVSQEDDVAQEGYSLNALLQTLTKHGATTQIVILDACRDNPFLATRSLSGGWAGVVTSAGTFIAFGTSPGSTASDDPGEGHGLFTQSLLKFIASEQDIDQMFATVRMDVIRRSNGQQVPWISSSLVGSFHVNPEVDKDALTMSDVVSGTIERNNIIGDRSITAGTDRAQESTLGVRSVMSLEESKELSSAVEQVRGFHLDKALDILRDILSVDPRCAIALRLIGIVYHLSGRSVESLDYMNRAIDINADDALAYSYRCLVAANQQSQTAEEECRKAISLDAQVPEAHFGLALVLMSKRQTTEAYSEATKAIALDPSSAASFSLRGEIERMDPSQGSSESDFATATQLVLSQ
jgi:tetratricopeptide (TPR) repeat protein